MCVCPGVSTSGLFMYMTRYIIMYALPKKKTLAFVRNCENLCIFDSSNTQNTQS